MTYDQVLCVCLNKGTNVGCLVKQTWLKYDITKE